MTKLIAALTAAVVGIMLGAAVPSAAKPTEAERTTTTCGTCVAPITCKVEDQCVLDFVGNGGNGYWRARQWNGTVWVRTTMVGGQ